MDGFLRRRTMMSPPASSPGDTWDFEWDYTMGLPENNGMTKTTSGTPLVYSLTEDGLKISTRNNSYVALALPTATMVTGVAECTFIPHNNTSNGSQNLRLNASNGTNGGATLMSANYFRRMDNSSVPGSSTPILQFVNDTEYTERIVLKGTTFDVYINGELALQDSPCSSILFCTVNRVMIQNTLGGYYTTIKNIRYKFNRTEG